MLKQRTNLILDGSLKKGLIIVALMVITFFLFMRFGYSMVSSDKTLGLVKIKNETNQKISFRKSQNENIQKENFVRNSSKIPDTKSETFIDPDIDPRHIRKVETQLVQHSVVQKIGTWNGNNIQHVSDANNKYPLLYANTATTIENPSRTVYLTFDDGPSPVTIDVLNVLKSRGVKATFFVIGNQVGLYPDILKQIVEDGHAIGIHTNTHNYKEVYTSLDSFLSDYEECYEKIKVVTDCPVTVTRYPGGSVNRYNKNLRDQTRDELKRRGFAYFDWNVSSGDSAPNGVTSEQFINNILTGIKDKNVAVILMHDAMGRTVTAESIGTVIDELTKMGYQFGVLGNNIKPVQF